VIGSKKQAVAHFPASDRPVSKSKIDRQKCQTTFTTRRSKACAKVSRPKLKPGDRLLPPLVIIVMPLIVKTAGRHGLPRIWLSHHRNWPVRRQQKTVNGASALATLQNGVYK